MAAAASSAEFEQTLSKPQILTYINHSLNYTPFDCKWIPGTARVAVVGQHARGAGAVQVFEMNKGTLELIAQDDKAVPLKCLTFGAHGTKEFAAGDQDGNVSIWSTEKLKVPLYTYKNAHSSLVNCIDGIGGIQGINCGSPEIVTGGRDGFVRVWDVRQKDKAVVEMGPPEGAIARDCWTVAFGNSFSNEERCVVAGYDNGDIKMYDLRTMSLRWQTNIGNGVCSVSFDRKDIKMNKLAASGLEGTLQVYDLRTQHPETGFEYCSAKNKKSSTVWTTRHLPQNRDLFMTSDGTGRLNLYKYMYPAKRVEKDTNGVEKGVAGTLALLNFADIADQPISSFDWNNSKRGLCAFTAFDQMLRIGIVTKLENY